MLIVKEINTYYSEIHALRNVSLRVDEGEIVTLIGSNGAGKSTLLNSISGVIPLHTGSILFDQIEITHLRPEKIVEQVIVQVPEGRQLFNPLTVFENLELGAYLRYLKGKKEEIAKDLAYVMDLFPVLRERRHQKAGTLSGGEQQMLSIARGLMSRPKMVLFDEPSLGMAPLVVVTIFDVIRRLRDDGTTILLVEQNARAALCIALRAYVIDAGRITLEGEAKALLKDEEVRKAYLGRNYREPMNGERQVDHSESTSF